jgi:hypothetical protein
MDTTSLPQSPEEEFASCFEEWSTREASKPQIEARFAQENWERAMEHVPLKKRAKIKGWADLSWACGGLESPTWKALTEEAEERSKVIVTEFEARQKILSDRMDALAPLVEARPGTEWLKVAEEYAYTSQPYGGAQKYAHVAALEKAEPFRRCGLEVDVRGAEVWVKATPATAELVRRKKITMDLEEWVRFWWKHGVNPRVYNPYLPPGYEQNHGIHF